MRGRLELVALRISHILVVKLAEFSVAFALSFVKVITLSAIFTNPFTE